MTACSEAEGAQSSATALPGGLQAELRAYQEDGFVWAMRLAQAGFGACLADDMGLGKTLQSLAVLLARSTGGAALVVAPTSVCGNWMAEAQRFAPGLRFMLYGESEREKLITAAGPGDVLVVSYNLMLQAGQGRAWGGAAGPCEPTQALTGALPVGSADRQNLRSVPAAVPDVWWANAPDRLCHRGHADQEDP